MAKLVAEHRALHSTACAGKLISWAHSSMLTLQPLNHLGNSLTAVISLVQHLAGLCWQNIFLIKITY